MQPPRGVKIRRESKTQPPPLSATIQTLLHFLKQSQEAYAYHYQQVGECDKATTDFSHALELQKLTRAERSKLTTKERNNLLLRRTHKNQVELLECLVTEMNNNRKEFDRVTHILEQVLGRVRKVEKYHESRAYRKRIPDEPSPQQSFESMLQNALYGKKR